MELCLERFQKAITFTAGKLYLDGKEFCYTLEDAVRPDGVKVYGETAIAAGRYRVIIDHSNHFGRNMIHILGVPQFDGIRMHGGNTAKDSEGCIICGKYYENGKVWHCADVIAKLEAKIKAALLEKQPVWITIVNTWEKQPFATAPHSA